MRQEGAKAERPVSQGVTETGERVEGSHEEEKEKWEGGFEEEHHWEVGLLGIDADGPEVVVNIASCHPGKDFGHPNQVLCHREKDRGMSHPGDGIMGDASGSVRLREEEVSVFRDFDRRHATGVYGIADPNEHKRDYDDSCEAESIEPEGAEAVAP